MNKNNKPIRMIRNDQLGELKKVFGSLTGMLTMVAFVLGFGFSGLQAQEESASFYNQVGDEITNEITVPCGEQFTLVVGIESNAAVNAVNITLDFDPALLQIAEDGVVDVSPAGFNVPLAENIDNENGMYMIEKGFIEFLPPFNPPAAGSYPFVEITFDVLPGVFTQPTVISYSADDIFIGSDATGTQILGDAPDFTVNVDCLDPEPIPGCTDPEACNFNPEATEDDDSCEYPQWYIPGPDGSGPAELACEAPDGYILADQDCAQEVVDDDPFCVNNSWDGICQGAYDDCTAVPGCIDDAACNFNPDANVDDGSCFFNGDLCETPEGGPGTIEDCECVPVVVVIPGCTNDAACNFNPDANEDDGSCLIIGESCDDGDDSTVNDTVNEDCECVGVPIPDNNLCEDAIAVVCGETVSGSNVGASGEGNPDIGFCGTTPSSAAVWYSWVSDGNYVVTATTCNEGTDYDTKLNVYSGSCGDFTCVGGNDDGSPDGTNPNPACVVEETGSTFNRASTVIFEAEPGVTYYMLVSGFGANTGNFDLTVSCEEIVCFADAGTMTADANPVVLDGPSVGISATPDGNANVPEGFGNAYVLTSGGDLVIQALGETPSFEVDMTGLYTIHSFVFDLDDLDAILDAVVPGETTGGDVLALIEELGLCASLDVAGAPINVIDPPPANDNCDGAAPLACGDLVEATTVGATADDAPFCGTSNGSGGGVWYSFMVDEQSNVTMSLCGSNYDTKLRVYTGSCDELECVGGNDDSCGLQSEVGFLAEPGVEYLVLVHGFNTAQGDFVLSVSCESTCDVEGGTIAYADGSEEAVICLGEGEELDVTLEGQGGSEGTAFAWVITDSDLNILALPEGPPFNFDDAGEGVCLIWHLAFDPENSNVLEIAGSENPNAGDLEGCFSLSNPLTVVRVDCTPSDCEDYEYYLADILEDGTTNIYEVVLSGTDANLSLIATSEYEVHIALNEDNGLIYAVSKLDGSFRILDPGTGAFGPVEMLDTEVSEIVGATFNPDGKLMILSQSENAIYSVQLGANAVSVFDSYSPSLGGDIDFADGALYLATREGFGSLYIAIPDEIASDIYVGTAPQLVTGIADTEFNNLIFSHRDATTLMVRSYGGVPGTPYDILLNGQSFMTFNGDLASGCADNRQPVEPCEQVIYYTNQPPGSGDYTLYSTVLNGDGTATNTALLSGLGSSHIGVTPDGSIVYIVGGNSLQAYDTDLGSIVSTVALTNEAGAGISNFPACVVTDDGTLYIAGNGNNIYSVDPGTGVATLLTNAYSVNGGDLVESPDGELWIITRNNNTFTRISDGLSFAVPVNEINGAAFLENGNVLLSDGNGDGDDALIEVNVSDLSVVATYDVEFSTNNGDLAATCVGGQEPLDPCIDFGACNAVSAVYIQGTTQGGGALPAARTDVNQSLGAPEGTDEMVFTTLGYGGSLTFEFDGVVTNGEGDDITVIETSFNNPGCESFPEYADVSVSADGENFFYIGTVCKGDNSVDISDAEEDFACVSYVRVANNDGLTSTGDGFDVDGIIAIHNCDNGDGAGEEEAIVVSPDNSNTLTAYPNPTNGPSQAIFVTGNTERATLEVYDMNGRLVQELFNGVAESGVEYRVDFDGIALPNGVYMYRLTTDSETIVEKFMIAK